MGTEEKDSEHAAHPLSKEQGSPEKEKETPVEHPQLSETADPLNTYKWHTGSKGTLNEPREEGDGAAATSTSTIDKIQKASSNKWSKMQNWRKALSEDPGDKNSTGGKSGEATKVEKGAGATRKNPFRRALSEPPGSLFAALTPSSSSASSAQPASSSAAPEAAGASSNDPSSKGSGGTIFKKYLWNVTQKLKRPRLQSRNSEHVPPQEVPLWDITNCILGDGQILITQEDECSPDPVGLPGGSRPKNQDGGVRGLIKRRLDKAKRNSTTQLQYGSRESVSVPVGSLDLSADTSTVIRPVHSSILGEKYCFEVINSENTHCFGCSSAAERDRWIEDLRRAAQPNKDNIERTENSLSLWVNEAKDLPPKRRYYCEVHLDGTLFARTSSRAVGKPTNRSSMAGDSASGSTGGLGGSGGAAGGCQLFWGEFFELDNLPSISQISLHLFREEDAKKKRHSRDESSLHPLGSVNIPLADIRGRTYQEKWYPITPFKASASAGNKEVLSSQASLRIKARFQNLKVLPMEKYKEFAEYVTVRYVKMCGNLEPLLNVKEKEELAGALVHVLQSIGKAKEFLIDLGDAEVNRLGEKEALIFRENTLATKAIDEYMKLVGQKYLIDTLDFINRLYASVENCEVDPLKCPAAELSSNQQHLRETCEDVVQKIIEIHSFPEELNKIFSNWMELCEDKGKAEIGQRLISASLFLRFLCPAILSPSLFGLTQAYPEPNTLRTLTLTAKVIQNLANSTFGEKEEYMLFMNEFLDQHWDGMKCFLQTVSNQDTEIPMTSFDGYVDLPLRLAVLHGLLVDIIYKKNQDTIDKLHPLPSILNQISDSLGPEAPRIIVNHTKPSKPVYVPPRELRKYSPLQSSLQRLPVDSKHAQELSELRLGIEQVTERELDMAKRLEDFIIQSQDQNAMLQAEVYELKNLLAVREEQLASATFLGVIEEEREEDERRLGVALAAAERMNVLEEQFAGLTKDLQQL
uniref:Uncharacterized protein n=1 Tax=Xiphophorus couchianus TaxID=32473 RepID=A0A3B5LWP3_9TELE